MKKFFAGLFVGAVALAVTMVAVIMNEVQNLSEANEVKP